MSEMTPREIVQELDKHIIGQDDAKRAVAIALRNRWRRQQVDDPLRSEITPKNILMIGPTGVGKTWIACAFAHKACREGYTALYLRLPRLFEELALAHADGRFTKLMAGFAKTDLIVLDDWGLAKLTAEQRRDLLELLDDRHGNRSTVVTSQLPVDHWHEIIGDPTLADAILDRLVHNSYRINLKGESMRKRYAKLTATSPSE